MIAITFQYWRNDFQTKVKTYCLLFHRHNRCICGTFDGENSYTHCRIILCYEVVYFIEQNSDVTAVISIWLRAELILRSFFLLLFAVSMLMKCSGVCACVCVYGMCDIKDLWIKIIEFQSRFKQLINQMNKIGMVFDGGERKKLIPIGNSNAVHLFTDMTTTTQPIDIFLKLSSSRKSNIKPFNI